MDKKFVSYQHVCKLQNDAETEGLLNGKVYIQSKLDGSNGCLWWDDEDKKVHGGSRKREVSVGSDNQGFFSVIATQKKYESFFKDHPNLRLYGEYGIKNNIKNYTEYGDFHVFDIIDENTGKYVNWEEFDGLLTPYDIKYIPIITVLNNPTIEEVLQYINKGRYLCGENTVQEGIVVKRQDFVNQWGRTVWGKVIQSEYLAKKHLPANKQADGVPIEFMIVEQFCTPAFIKKEYEKLLHILEEEGNTWEKRWIGRLLSTIWYEFITEESYHFVKAFKNPTINYAALQKIVTQKIRDTLPELFRRE